MNRRYLSETASSNMAIHPVMIPPPQAPSNIQQSANVAAWTEQATQAIQSINLSAEAAPHASRRTTVALSVPLDTRHASPNREATGNDAYKIQSAGQVHTIYRRSEPMRRDSLKRREALLKGKEGSRQRRRWENGMFIDDLNGVRS